MTKSTRERIKAKRRRNRTRNILIGAVIVIAAGMGIAWLATQSRARASGETVPIEAVEFIAEDGDRTHVPEGTDPGPYNSSPPTSGKHYAVQSFDGFYTEEDLPGFGEYPLGYLVHSLEHGYIIFWYNCDLLSADECEVMKDDIERVMGRVGNFKVIAFPWTDQDVPVVLTSWERMLKMDEFDAELAEQFVRNFRNVAPEPGAM